MVIPVHVSHSAEYSTLYLTMCRATLTQTSLIATFILYPLQASIFYSVFILLKHLKESLRYFGTEARGEAFLLFTTNYNA